MASRGVRCCFVATLVGLHPGIATAAALAPAAEAEEAFTRAIEAIRSAQWAQAELLLERSIMLNPEHAGARLELAGLLAVRGRADAARALIASLIEDPRTPEAYRERLQAMLAQLERPVPVPAEARVAEVRSEAFVAWARNPLARTDVRQLTLTLPDGPLTLPLSQRASPGALVGGWVSRVQPGGLSVDAGYQRLLGSDTLEAYRVGFHGELPLIADNLRPRWLAQSQRSYDGLIRHSVGLSAGRDAWGLAGGLFTEPDLGRHGAFLRAERLGRPVEALRTVIYMGLEHAGGGGSPSYGVAGVAAAWNLAPDLSLIAQGGLHRDFAGYSPLLADGAARWMRTANLALERAWQPAGGRWQLVARLQAGQRWSNLDLFDYRDAGVQLSLRQRWD